jgi:hypothetical protein
MTDQLLREKFVDQCAGVLGEEGARKASDISWKLESAKDVSGIARSL